MPDICYDTEFLDDGETIELISIGLVLHAPGDEHVAEYYAINADCDIDRVMTHPWLRDNVVPHLPLVDEEIVPQDASLTASQDVLAWLEVIKPRKVLDRINTKVKPKWVIANEVREFIRAAGEDVRLWAYYGAYDHVALAQLWGPMSELPSGIPMWTHDLMQLWEQRPEVVKPPQWESLAHDALQDARWNSRFLTALQRGQ